MFQAILQAIEVGETLFPALMAGLHIDMPGPRENPRFGAPVTRQFQGAGGADGAVVVGADNLAWERQQMIGDWREVTQGGRSKIRVVWDGRFLVECQRSAIAA